MKNSEPRSGAVLRIGQVDTAQHGHDGKEIARADLFPSTQIG